MTQTLLDIEQARQKETDKRKKNIKVLTEMLDEAKALHSVIKDKTPEANKERGIVWKEINRLEQFIESEQKAIDSFSFSPSDESVKRVFG